MVGAVAGTPGTLPTNWSTFTTLTGLTREVVGTGTENGITYIDIRLSGTPSAAGGYVIYEETPTGVAALQNQTWTISQYVKLQAGTLSGISLVRLYFQENNSGGGYLTEQQTTITNPTSASLSSQRASATRTLTNASTAFLSGGLTLSLSGAAIDITLRIGLPQLEQGAFATSVIPTTTTALTRSADVASVNTLSPWFNAVEGTLFVETSRGYTGNFVNFPHTAGLSDGTSANVIWAGYAINGSQNITPEILTGGVDQLNFVTGTYSMSTAKNAIAYKTNDSQWFFNGAAFATDTTCTMPSGLNRLSIGSDTIGGQPWNGWIRRVTYYPRRLSQTDGIAITA